MLKKLFEKDVLKQSKNCFKKTWNMMFDWSKNRFDQSNQAEAHRIFKARFRLIENKIGSIEILEKTVFERKKKTWFFEILPQSIEFKKKMHENEMKCSPKTQVLIPIFQKFRF